MLKIEQKVPDFKMDVFHNEEIRKANNSAIKNYDRQSKLYSAV